MIENDYCKVLTEGDFINHLFKANKTMVKSAKFLLAPKNYKTNLNDINVEDQGKNLIINQIINKNDKFDEFIQYFTGLTKKRKKIFCVKR